jgi:hypothetical protein
MLFVPVPEQRFDVRDVSVTEGPLRGAVTSFRNLSAIEKQRLAEAANVKNSWKPSSPEEKKQAAVKIWGKMAALVIYHFRDCIYSIQSPANIASSQM